MRNCVCVCVCDVKHGIGVNSLSVVMNELLKLLYHASATDVTFFRIGTCGGLGKLVTSSQSCYSSCCLAKLSMATDIVLCAGLAPGTVVITEEALDGAFNPTLDMVSISLQYH